VRRLLIGCSCIFLFVLAGAAWWFYGNKVTSVLPVFSQKNTHDSAKNHRIIIFVHGTFGAILSLLDAPAVLRDKIGGSFYAKAVDNIRKAQFFFRSQPLHHCGLVPFEPSFDSSGSVGFFAAYPIAQSYEEIAQQSQSAAEKRHYYLFGWSGMLSQSSRQQEAVRLLNELSEEIKKFKERGIEPKISVFCHSHGGNLVLNVGMLVSLLRGEVLSQAPGVVHDKHLRKLRRLLGRLPAREHVASDIKGPSRWDFCPETPAWDIDQLVLLATPVQPETDAGIFSSAFKKIYHCYSYGDLVQVSDFISTSRYFSERRFNRLAQKLHRAGQTLPEKLLQIRMMVGKKMAHDEQRILSAPASFDPSHKDFWFLMLKQTQLNHVFRPLPLVSFLPVVVDLVSGDTVHTDVDVNIAQRPAGLSFELLSHNQYAIMASRVLSRDFFESVRTRASKWSEFKGIFASVLQSLHLL